ncbi:MAG: cbb3-type cytochrome c oxidase subunit 3 [Pseudomonadales bacterium]|jgi:cytochrome c oxidase cbb3-type subunit 4|nr:cbb3-type cytochrome c oxidase subunit 3 [Pseudomonadales bacterium]
MNPLWGHLSGIITLLVMLSFIGVWIWVWDRRHLPKYDELARLPLQDQEEA